MSRMFRKIEVAREDCTPYGEWAPTALDCRGLNLPDRQHWLVAPVNQTRDSEDDPLTASNWRVFQSMLEEACEDCECEEGCYETHSFGHWACGWFEVVLVNPACFPAMAVLGDVVSALASYCILDEHDFSKRESEAAQEAWEWLDMRERMKLCVDNGVHWLQARHDYPPQDDWGGIHQSLLGY